MTDAEENQSESHGKRMRKNERERLNLSPHCDKFGTLDRWIKEDTAAVPSKTEKSECHEHSDVQCDAAGDTCEKCLHERRSHGCGIIVF